MSKGFPHCVVYHVEVCKRPHGWNWTNQQTLIPIINKEKNNVRVAQQYNLRSVLEIIYGCNTIGRIHKCDGEKMQTNNKIVQGGHSLNHLYSRD